MLGRRRHNLRALIGLSLLATSCTSAPVEPTKPSLERDLYAIVRARLATVERDGTHRVRFNPVACDCPELEVFAADVWHRVALVDGDSRVLEAMRSALDKGGEAARGAEYLIQGRLGDTPGRCGRAALYLTLEPEAWLGEKP